MRGSFVRSPTASATVLLLVVVVVVGIVGVGAIRIIVRARCVFAIFWNKHWIDVTLTSTDVTYVVPMLVKHIDL